MYYFPASVDVCLKTSYAISMTTGHRLLLIQRSCNSFSTKKFLPKGQF